MATKFDRGHSNNSNQPAPKTHWRQSEHVDGLMNQCEALVGAALDENWTEVGRVSNSLARSGDINGYSTVSADARQLCRTLNGPHSPLDAKRGVLQVVASCGRCEQLEDLCSGK